jgi:hypothetical protein
MSADGLHWQRATTPPNAWSEFQAIAPSEEGWVYIDITCDTPGGVYLSADGSTWTELNHIPDVHQQDGHLWALPDRRLLFADATSDGQPRIRVSSDGVRTWIPATIEPLPEQLGNRRTEPGESIRTFDASVPGEYETERRRECRSERSGEMCVIAPYRLICGSRARRRVSVLRLGAGWFPRRCVR